MILSKTVQKCRRFVSLDTWPILAAIFPVYPGMPIVVLTWFLHLLSSDALFFCPYWYHRHHISWSYESYDDCNLIDNFTLSVHSMILSSHHFGSNPLHWIPFSPSFCLCLHFNGHFPGGPGLASTGMSQFWILLKQDDGGSGDNWDYKTCKAPVKMSPPTNVYPVVIGWMPHLVTQPTVSKHWMEI